MGINVLPSMRLYWNADPLFYCEPIAKTMPLKRFLSILRFLHLNDNSKMPKPKEPQFDRLYKVRPMINFLKEKYYEIFSPSRYLSVDESMVGFKVRSSLKQYLPNKPTKRGFKVWVMACASTGFVLNFDVYEGKTGKRNKDESLGEHVVIGISKCFENLGYCLFFDRFFTSLPLCKKLFTKSLFSCATIMSNRVGFPNTLLKKDKELTIGDHDFAVEGELSIIKWKDRGKKSVKIISTMHDPEDMTQVDRKNKKGEKVVVKCPRAIADYNAYMGGVDHFDHIQSTYSIIQKSRKWWMKLFYFF